MIDLPQESHICGNCGRPKSTTYAQLKTGECGAHDAPHFLLGLAMVDCEMVAEEKKAENDRDSDLHKIR